jgi:FkbM family methyltransferase
LCKKRVWYIRSGPLKGFRLVNLLNDEIAPVLANKMEIRCSKLLEQLPLKGKRVIDVGGSFGYYALILSRLVGEKGGVYIFEPDWRSFERLTHNLAINNRTNSTAIPICLSDQPFGLVGWDSYDEEPWKSRMAESVEEAKPKRINVVPVTMLDEFVRILGIGSDKISLIKIDVEGGEFKVLRGAEGILHDSKPLILCELHGRDIARQVFRFFKDLGYQWEMIEYMNEARQHIFAWPVQFRDQYEVLVSPFVVKAYTDAGKAYQLV